MKILVCGANGFVGRHVVHALQSGGHEVLRGVSSSAPHPSNKQRQIDFVQACEPGRWSEALHGVDAVVNAVGVLRDSRARPMQALHADAPAALFEACARQGVRKVIHVSALGIEGNPTHYARTKLAAEAALLSHVQAGRLDGVVLRPSIVFGRGGDSSRLFTALAQLPWLCLPSPVITAKVQPIAVNELAEGVGRLLGSQPPLTQGLLNVVGPRHLPLADFIGSLRKQMGRGAARMVTLPALLTRWSARAGDWVPWAPWCSETLALLAQDNVADPSAFAAVLGRAAKDPDHLLASAT